MDNYSARHETFWLKAKNEIRNTLPDHAFNTWFEPVNAIALTKDELILEVPNQFFYEWLKSHYQGLLEKTVNQAGENKVAIKFTVSASASEKPESWQRLQPSEPAPPSRQRTLLNKKYTFSNFIEGKNNQFAKAAALTVAESPGHDQFNPLVIYGGVGLGKTHLLHAIGNQIQETKPDAAVVLAPSEKFTRDFISSIRKNKTVEFAKMYRRADVLLIDDIQFFQGKEQTQEQFFHTFNDLYQTGKQIVMTADRYPGELDGLMDRLLSRFESGLSVDIQPPSFETRVAILMEMSEENGMELPYNLIEFIAMHVKSSVRDIESTLIRLLAYSSLSKEEIDQRLVKKVVQERLGKRLIAEVSAEDIIKRVSEITHIPEREIIGKSRKKNIAEARHLSIYLIRDILNMPLVNIGLHFSGRDHSTILHACRAIEERIQKEDRINNTVQTLKQQLMVVSG
ncbi:MAG: chromosomal replication initiator protein DnaA [Fidelibacterota bacterium]